jgi:hypothetical protein
MTGRVAASQIESLLKMLDVLPGARREAVFDSVLVKRPLKFEAVPRRKRAKRAQPKVKIQIHSSRKPPLN